MSPEELQALLDKLHAAAAAMREAAAVLRGNQGAIAQRGVELRLTCVDQGVANLLHAAAREGKFFNIAGSAYYVREWSMPLEVSEWNPCEFVLTTRGGGIHPWDIEQPDIICSTKPKPRKKKKAK